VIAATHQSELPFMETIYQNGIKNGVEGVEKITANQLKEIEPNVESIGGIFVACTGIIDFKAATRKMVELTLNINPQSQLFLGYEVEKTYREGNSSIIITKKGKFKANRLIFCGGLFADRLAKQ